MIFPCTPVRYMSRDISGTCRRGGLRGSWLTDGVSCSYQCLTKIFLLAYSAASAANELRHCGVPKFDAAVAAGSPTGFWRMSGHPAVQQALRNHYFDSLGLPRLHVPDQA